MPPIIEFDKVTVRFDRGLQFPSEVLEDVSFRLEESETKVLLGAAGSGKSVLLKTALGLIPADEGVVKLFGQDLGGLTESQMFPLRLRAGMVFQESALFDSLTVGENVGYIFQEERTVPEEEEERRVDEALRFVELEGTENKMPAELSGGMRRRVAIARAFVGGPPLMLYDSPTAGLDPVTAHRIMLLVVKLRDMQRVSALLVTNRLQDAHVLVSSRFNPQTGRLGRTDSAGVPKGELGLDRAASLGNGARTSFLVLREGTVVFEGGERELFAARDSYVRKFVE
jgi:phospholipid/cholesterol/gamma-HCH transport system ATP-binding protein